MGVVANLTNDFEIKKSIVKKAGHWPGFKQPTTLISVYKKSIIKIR